MKPRDQDALAEMLKLARSLGYSLVCIEAESIQDYQLLARLSRELGLRVCVRATIAGETRREVRREIERAKKTYGVKPLLIAVRAKTLDASRYSATSKEVSLTRVEPGEEAAIDRSQARLFAQRGWGAVEIILRPVLAEWNLAYLARAVSRALRSGVELVVSSDSREPWEMWSPYHVIGLLVTLGAPEDRARTWVSSAPARVADRVAVASLTAVTRAG